MDKIEIIARFLEDIVREDDAERERFPSLKRIPKADDTWIGWVASAKKLDRHLTSAMHSDGQGDVAEEIWTNEDESAEIERQVVKNAAGGGEGLTYKRKE